MNRALPLAPVLTVSNVAEGPDVPTVEAMGWGPVVGDGSGLADTLKGRLAEGWRVVLAADGAGSAERLDQSFRDLGVAGATVVVAPLERGVTLPNVKVAIVAESDITGRRRAHRKARPRKRESAGFFEDLKPGSYVVHVTHGVGRYEGMVKRAIGGVERDYLLLAYRGGDKLYIPSDQIDTQSIQRDASLPPGGDCLSTATGGRQGTVTDADLWLWGPAGVSMPPQPYSGFMSFPTTEDGVRYAWTTAGSIATQR